MTELEVKQIQRVEVIKETIREMLDERLLQMIQAIEAFRKDILSNHALDQIVKTVLAGGQPKTLTKRLTNILKPEPQSAQRLAAQMGGRAMLPSVRALLTQLIAQNKAVRVARNQYVLGATNHKLD